MVNKKVVVNPDTTPIDITEDVRDIDISMNKNKSDIYNLTISNYISKYGEAAPVGEGVIETEDKIKIELAGRNYAGFIRKMEPRQKPQEMRIVAYGLAEQLERNIINRSYSSGETNESITKDILDPYSIGYDIDPDTVYTFDDGASYFTNRLKILKRLWNNYQANAIWWIEGTDMDKTPWRFVTSWVGRTSTTIHDFTSKTVSIEEPISSYEKIDETIVTKSWNWKDAYNYDERPIGRAKNTDIATPYRNTKKKIIDLSGLPQEDWEEKCEYEAQQLLEDLNEMDVSATVEAPIGVDVDLRDAVKYKNPKNANIERQDVQSINHHLSQGDFTTRLELKGDRRVLDEVTPPGYLRDAFSMEKARESSVVYNDTTPTDTTKLWCDYSATPHVFRRYDFDAGAWKKASYDYLSDMLGDADDVSEGSVNKWAGESGADITGDHQSDVYLGNISDKLHNYLSYSNTDHHHDGVRNGTYNETSRAKNTVYQNTSNYDKIINFALSKNLLPDEQLRIVGYISNTNSSPWTWTDVVDITLQSGLNDGITHLHSINLVVPNGWYWKVQDEGDPATVHATFESELMTK